MEMGGKGPSPAAKRRDLSPQERGEVKTFPFYFAML
jgi:hypothetical protein